MTPDSAGKLDYMSAVGPMARLFETVAAWRDRVFPASDRLNERYLSAAVDRVDLEQRLRTLERRPTPFWDGI